MTFASLFTGMGAADIGASQAGLTPIWGVEIDRDIALIADREIHAYNYTSGIFNVNVIDVNYSANLEYSTMERPDWLHASPPCINASRAKNGKETPEDIELANAICKAIEVLQPDYFSLENVIGYATFNSFNKIKLTLLKAGYNVAYIFADCEDYGIPQSRKRLFLVASKHYGKVSGLYDLLHKRQTPIGWYEAIADLIPTLKPIKLTEWQKRAIIKRNITEHQGWMDKFVIQRSGARKKDGIPNNTIRFFNEPMFTIKAMSGKVRVNPKQATIVIDGQPYEADTRCLARWQTIPDWYQFSGDLKLDTKMIGNAVPPLMMQKVIESVLQ
jgi:DNA (cytosine-5)-methyltransferase 1